MSGIVDVHGVPARKSTLLGLGRAYDGAQTNRKANSAWGTAPIAGASETQWDRMPLGARARDLVRNHPNAAAALRKWLINLIGPGFRLRSKPDAQALGVDPREALKFGRQIEAVWKKWAYSRQPYQGYICDIRGEFDYGTICRVRAAERYVTGESLHVLRWQERPNMPFATTIQLIDSDRLSNEHDGPDQDLLRQGLELDEAGRVLNYMIRDRHPADWVAQAKRFSWTQMPRFDVDGRRVTVLSYRPDRAEQLRGISPFAPVLMRLKELDRYITAELGASVLNALLTGFVKTTSDPSIVAEALGLETGAGEKMFSDWLQAREKAYGEDGVAIGDNMFAFLGIGDDVEIPNTARETTSVPEFKKAHLRDAAGALGHGYSGLSSDYESVNYSSARAEGAEIWRGVLQERETEVANTVRPDFAAVVEEAFDRGYLVEPPGWPSFENEGEAYLTADWTGPGKGYVDPLKEAQGNQIQLEQGATTLDRMCADQGMDWEDVLSQRRIELDRMQELGLSPLKLEAALMVGRRTEEEEPK